MLISGLTTQNVNGSGEISQTPVPSEHNSSWTPAPGPTYNYTWYPTSNYTSTPSPIPCQNSTANPSSNYTWTQYPTTDYNYTQHPTTNSSWIETASPAPTIYHNGTRSPTFTPTSTPTFTPIFDINFSSSSTNQRIQVQNGIIVIMMLFSLTLLSF